jgi:hypothetical protein
VLPCENLSIVFVRFRATFILFREQKTYCGLVNGTESTTTIQLQSKPL